MNMWLRLTHLLDIDPDDLLADWQLLRLTRKEFVQFVLSKTSASCDTAWQIWSDLWQLYGTATIICGSVTVMTV